MLLPAAAVQAPPLRPCPPSHPPLWYCLPNCAGAGYIHNTPSFRAHFPKLRFVTLGASVINFVPIIRDIGHWLGLRVIKRRTFVAALREVRRGVT